MEMMGAKRVRIIDRGKRLTGNGDREFKLLLLFHDALKGPLGRDILAQNANDIPRLLIDDQETLATREESFTPAEHPRERLAAPPEKLDLIVVVRESHSRRSKKSRQGG
ncbi:hypothetical protein VTN02DRAFT_4027 [Thermoascus thermophilus]